MSFSLHSSTENFGGGAQVLVVGIELQLELERLGEVLDRGDVAEGLGQAVLQEPVERVALDGDEVGQLEDLVEVGERIAVPDGGAGRQGRLLEHGVHAGVVAPGRGGTTSRTDGGAAGEHDSKPC